MLLRAYREFVKDPSERKGRGWLIRLAREHLEAEVKRLKSERYRTVHIEKDIPETPPTQKVSTLGDEILDFYQPDEDLKLEDVIPDIKIPTPEQATEIKELWQCVNSALAEMPPDWRRALSLFYVDELEGGELAEAIGSPESELERILQDAREYLRQMLIERGCQFK